MVHTVGLSVARMYAVIWMPLHLLTERARLVLQRRSSGPDMRCRGVKSAKSRLGASLAAGLACCGAAGLLLGLPRSASVQAARQLHEGGDEAGEMPPPYMPNGWGDLTYLDYDYFEYYYEYYDYDYLGGGGAATPSPPPSFAKMTGSWADRKFAMPEKLREHIKELKKRIAAKRAKEAKGEGEGEGGEQEGADAQTSPPPAGAPPPEVEWEKELERNRCLAEDFEGAKVPLRPGLSGARFFAFDCSF